MNSEIRLRSAMSISNMYGLLKGTQN